MTAVVDTTKNNATTYQLSCESATTSAESACKSPMPLFVVKGTVEGFAAWATASSGCAAADKFKNPLTAAQCK